MVANNPVRSSSIPPPPPPLPDDSNLDAKYGDIANADANNTYSNNYIADDQSVEAQHVVYTFHEEGGKKSSRGGKGSGSSKGSKRRCRYLMVTVVLLLSIILALGIVYGKQLQDRKQAKTTLTEVNQSVANNVVDVAAGDDGEEPAGGDVDPVVVDEEPSSLGDAAPMVPEEDIYLTPVVEEQPAAAGDETSVEQDIAEPPMTDGVVVGVPGDESTMNDEDEVFSEQQDMGTDIPTRGTAFPTRWWQRRGTTAPSGSGTEATSPPFKVGGLRTSAPTDQGTEQVQQGESAGTVPPTEQGSGTLSPSAWWARNRNGGTSNTSEQLEGTLSPSAPSSAMENPPAADAAAAVLADDGSGAAAASAPTEETAVVASATGAASAPTEEVIPVVDSDIALVPATLPEATLPEADGPEATLPEADGPEAATAPDDKDGKN